MSDSLSPGDLESLYKWIEESKKMLTDATGFESGRVDMSLELAQEYLVQARAFWQQRRPTDLLPPVSALTVAKIFYCCVQLQQLSEQMDRLSATAE